jgi:hypothetical protein
MQDKTWWEKVKFVVTDVIKSIALDVDSRFFHLFYIVTTPLSHVLVEGFSAHYWLVMTQLILGVTLVGLALRQSSVAAHQELFVEAVKCVDAYEKRFHRDQDRLKFLEESLNAHKGVNPETYADGVRLN